MRDRFKILYFLPLTSLFCQSSGRHVPEHPNLEPLRFIEVEGNRRVDKGAILDFFPPQKKYTQQELDSILKQIFNTNVFQDVKITDKGERLLVTVVENPFLNQVVFEGNKEVPDEDLKSVVALSPRQPFTVSRVREAEQALLSLYRTKGRYGTLVSSEIIKRDFNRVDLIFKIQEGPKAYIRDILFVGNRTFSAATLSKAISSQEARWYAFMFPPEEIYNPERVKYDEELLRQFYFKNGYADARIEASHAELSADQKGFVLTFILHEGERYKFGSTSIESEVPGIDSDRLKTYINWKEGEWFNNQLVQSASEMMSTSLFEKGVPFIEIIPVPSQSKGAMDIKFVVRPTPHRYIKSINIKGNLGTDDTVIRRELTFAEGDAVNAAKISRSERNLQELDFFESVEISETPGPAPDLRHLLVQVKEKSTGEIQCGGGYSSMEGIIGRIGYLERNFLGKGYEAHVNGQFARRGTDLDMGVSIPHFMERPVTVSSNVFYSQAREDTRGTFSHEGGYRQRMSGFDVRAVYELRKNLYQGWSYKVRHDSLSFPRQVSNKLNSESMSPYLIENLQGHHRQWVMTLGHDLVYDRLERRALEPVGGWFAKLANEWSGLGGNIRCLSNTFSAGQYFSLDEDKRFILRLEARYGLIAKLGYMRFMDQYYLGGFAFPGFAEAGVGPRDMRAKDALGGRQYYTASAKLYFPLGLPKELPTKGVVYAQSGSLWNPLFKGPGIASRTFKNRFSLGGGVICTIPFIGKLGIILTKVLGKRSEDKRQTALFIWGQEF